MSLQKYNISSPGDIEQNPFDLLFFTEYSLR